MSGEINNQMILNVQKALEAFDNDHEFYGELLDDVENLLAEKSPLLKRAVEQNDCQQINFYAHTIKGALRNVAADSAALFFADLEELGLNNDAAGAQKLIQETDIHLEKLMQAINGFRQEYLS